jgi:hypothetical protein
MVSVTEQNNSTSPFLPWMSLMASKGLTELTPEAERVQMAMGLPPSTSVIFLIAIMLLTCDRLAGITDMSPLALLG